MKAKALKEVLDQEHQMLKLTLDVLAKENEKLNALLEETKKLNVKYKKQIDDLMNVHKADEGELKKLKNEKAIKNLEQCGNRISECDDIEIVEILKRYFKKEAKMRKEAKWV